MKKIIFLLFILCIISCKSKNDTQNTNEHHVFTEPVFPTSGKNLKIYYDPKHKDAIFKTEKEMFCTITVFDFYGIDRTRILMNDSAGVFVCNYTIPKNSNYIMIEFAPKNVYRTQEYVTSVVYDEKEKPMPGGIAHLISNSKSHKEALDYYKESKEIFPNDFSRDVAIWEALLSQDMNTSEIELQADSLFGILKTNKELKTEEYQSGLCACFVAYTYLKKWDNLENTISLVVEANKTRLINDFYHSRKLFENLFQEKDKKIQKRILKMIVELMQNNNTINFEADFYQNYTENKIKDKYDVINDIAKKKLLNILENNNIEDNNVFINFLISFIDYNTIKKNYQYVIALINKSLIKLNDFFIKNYWEKYNTHISTIPNEGRKGILVCQLYEAQLLNKDTISAINTITNYINNEVLTEYNKGGFSISSVHLFDIYFNKNDIENSKKTLKRVFEYNSPYSEDRFNKLQNKLKLLKLDTLDINSYHKTDLFKIKKLEMTEINCTKSKINLSNIKDSVLFVFVLDESCIACNFGFIAAFDTLSKVKNLPIKILAVSKTNNKEFDKVFSKGILISQDKDYLQAIFEVNRTPALVIIKNHYIIEKIHNFPNVKEAYILLLNKAIAQKIK